MGWGTQCIAAGSHIANHEAESVELRPHASNLTKYMSQVREAIREQCFTDRLAYSEKVCFTNTCIRRSVFCFVLCLFWFLRKKAFLSLIVCIPWKN